MKNFIKKYWSHVFNISVLAYLIGMFKIFSNLLKEGDTANTSYLIVLLLIELLMVLGVWTEIIYYTIKAVRSKELNNKGVHIAGIYFLNLFYIPCFSLKHIHKDSKAKMKNIIYVVITVCMFAVFCLYILRFQETLNL